MNPLEWYNFVKELLNWDAERIAAFWTGCGVTLLLGFVAILLYRRFVRRRGREQALVKVVELTREKAELQARITRLEAEAHSRELELHKLQQTSENQQREIQVCQKQRHELELGQSGLDKQVKTVELHGQAARQEISHLQVQCQNLKQIQEGMASKITQLEEEKKQQRKKEVRMLLAGKRLVAERNRLQQDCQEMQSQVQVLGQGCEELQEEIGRLASGRQDLESSLGHARDEVNLLTGQVQAIQEQMRSVTELEGKIWERPVEGPVPAFRPLAERRAPIVAIANLKGGVGKTTLTANLGAALWEEGKRVLLVDLDYQGSLTSLCLPEQDIADLKGAGRLVHKLFQPGGNTNETFNSCRTRIGQSQGFLLATNDKLADVEMEAMSNWLLDGNCPDIRFTLREVLHSPQVQNEFDVILLDCPPRLTTASINALTACDYALIPVLLDVTSAEAVPRYLGWLKVLKATPLCSQLSILGVLANRAHYYKEDLVSRERVVWDELPKKCQDVWGGRVYHFATIFKEEGQFAESARRHTFAALSPRLKPFFLDLVREFHRRIKSHESR